MTFAKGIVRNTAGTDLEVDSATLMLLDKNDVTVGKLNYTFPIDWTIEPEQSKPIELEGWIPTALIKDISHISGRLAFSHKKEANDK